MPPDQGRARALEPPHLALVVPVADDVVSLPQHRVDVEVTGHRRARARDPARLRQHLSRPEQHLARDAGPIGAFAADERRLDHRDARPAFDAASGDVLARGATSDDDDVELLHVLLLGCHQCRRCIVARPSSWERE